MNEIISKLELLTEVSVVKFPFLKDKFAFSYNVRW